MKIEKKTRFITILLYVSVFIGVVGAALLFYGLRYEFDDDIMHFAADSVATMSNKIVAIAGAVIALIGLIVSGSKTEIRVSEEKVSFVETVLCILISLMMLLYCFVRFRAGFPEERIYFPMISMAFSLFSVVYYVIKGLGCADNKPKLGITAAIPALFFTATALEFYFDRSRALNSPVTTLITIMLACYMLYYTEEAGVSVSRPATASKYIGIGLACVSISGMTSIGLFAEKVTSGDPFDSEYVLRTIFVLVWILTLIVFAKKIPNIREKEPENELEDKKKKKRSKGTDTSESIEEIGESVESSDSSEKSESSENPEENVEDSSAD